MNSQEDVFPRTSQAEELANSITHGIGFALSLIGGFILISAAGQKDSYWWLVVCGVYALALISTFGASTLSHAFQSDHRRRRFRIIDQSVIYLLIAGTYTPFAMAYFHGGWWIVFAGVWAIALAGFFCKLLSGKQRMGPVSTVTYLFLGWVPGMIVLPMLYDAPQGGVWWLATGGLCYSIGFIFLVLDQKIRFSHTVWHLFVLAGSSCHYVAILFYTLASAQ